jgi:hypothetical protein
MTKVRLASLSVLAVTSVFAIFASQAMAKIRFEWFVGGKLLAAGQSKAFTVSSDGKIFTINGSVAGAKIQLLSNEVAVTGGKILGGTPGTNEERLLFKNVVVDNPAKCLVESESSGTPGLIQTKSLKTEIVESQANGEPLILFSPETGNTWVELRFLNKGTETCPVASTENLVPLTGSVLAEPLPQLAELLTNDLDFEAKTKNYLQFGGVNVRTAGLSIGLNPATFAGLILVRLTETDEKFGAF